MGKYTSKRFPDWYRDALIGDLQERDRNNNLLNTIDNLFGKYMDIQGSFLEEKKKEEKEEEHFDRIRRDRGVQKLELTDSDVNPYDFGNPITNESDYRDYKNAWNQDQKMKERGSSYTPYGGVISKEAQRDMFTYGDTTYALDTSPGVIAYDDVVNFEAWILGPDGMGSHIAKRHKWKGVLNDYRDELGGYVLDEGDYRELLDKGIVDQLSLNSQGLYIINQNQRDKIAKNYKSWKKGFEQSNTKIFTKSELDGMIETSNTKTLALEKQMRDKNDPLNEAYEATKKWNDFWSTDGERGGILEQLEDGGDINIVTDYYTIEHFDPSTGNVKIIPGSITADNPMGDPIPGTRTPIELSDFKKKYPTIYNFIVMPRSTEAAYQEYVSNPAISEALSFFPRLKNTIQGKFMHLININNQRRAAGISVDNVQYMEDQRVMGEGRDILLGDLTNSRETGFGVIFDDEAFDKLKEDEQNEIVNQMYEFENRYIDENSIHQNQHVVNFLRLYGYGEPGYEPGTAIFNLIRETKSRAVNPMLEQSLNKLQETPYTNVSQFKYPY